MKLYNGGLPDWIRKRYPVLRTVDYPKVNIPKVFPEQVYKNINKFVILDIGGEALRRIGEFNRGDVIHIPLDDLEEKYTALPRDKKIVIVDVMGKQENIAGRFLTMKGYTNLAEMAGGGRAWFKTIRIIEMEKKKRGMLSSKEKEKKIKE